MWLRWCLAPMLVLMLMLGGSISRAADEPAWLTEARARESRPGEVQAIVSKDLWFKARVPARLTEDIVKEQGSYTVGLDIGTDTPIYCEVFPDGFDLGNTLRRTAEQSLQEVGKTQGNIEAREVEFTDAGAMGDAPFIEARWLYQVNTGNESRIGSLKQIALRKRESGIYCGHLDVGYVETFHAVVRAFADSFDAPAAESPYYLEIASSSIRGRKYGVKFTRFMRDPYGDTKAVQTISTLFPKAGGKLKSQDAASIEWTRPDGSLINASQTVVNNDRLATDLALKPVTDGWIVAGEIDGKKIELKLPEGAQPGSRIEQALALRAILARPDAIGTEHSIPLWLTSENKLTDARTKITARKSATEFTARGTSGVTATELTLDAASGMPAAVDVGVIGWSYHFEREFVRGQF